MREYILDANVLMSVLISGRADYKPLLKYFNFILPDFVLVELEKYSHIITKKNRLGEPGFSQWTYFVFSHLTILPNYTLQAKSLNKAETLLQNVDLKDISYIALAMQLDLPLLTRDKKFYHGVRKKGYRKLMLFEDFLQSL